MDNKKNIFFNTELEPGNQSIIMRDHTEIENTSTTQIFLFLFMRQKKVKQTYKIMKGQNNI